MKRIDTAAVLNPIAAYALQKLKWCGQFLLVLIRIIPVGLLLAYLVFIQSYLLPWIIFSPLRRYISCLNNLLILRVVLFLCGIGKIDSKNYQYFNKSSNFRGQCLKFASGWIGVAPSPSLVDFLYYSCIFNPIYVRMIEYHDEEQLNHLAQPTIKMFYQPLPFKQSLILALSDQHGFNPIVLKGKMEFRKCKVQKLQIKSLIRESHQQMNGPILVFLPKNQQNIQLALNGYLYDQIVQNNTHYARAGVAFHTQVISSFPLRNKGKNIWNVRNTQLSLAVRLCSSYKLSTLIVEKFSIMATQYDNYYFDIAGRSKPLSNPVDKFYREKGIIVLNQDFQSFFHNNIKAEQEEEEENSSEGQKGKRSKKKKKAKGNKKKYNRAH